MPSGLYVRLCHAFPFFFILKFNRRLGRNFTNHCGSRYCIIWQFMPTVFSIPNQSVLLTCTNRNNRCIRWLHVVHYCDIMLLLTRCTWLQHIHMSYMFQMLKQYKHILTKLHHSRSRNMVYWKVEMWHISPNISTTARPIFTSGRLVWVV